MVGSFQRKMKTKRIRKNINILDQMNRLKVYLIKQVGINITK
jgi:hypothetical protein